MPYGYPQTTYGGMSKPGGIDALKRANGANYECMHCGKAATIDDEYMKVAPNWCKYCEKVRYFERLDEE